jgi:transcription antitermination factor NusG
LETAITDPWYVARVRTGARDVRRAQDALADRGYETFYPRFIERDRRGESVKPYFVGYLFVCCPGGLWGEAARAPGVVSVLGNPMTGFAAEAPGEFMRKWREICGPSGVHDPIPARRVVARFEPNAPVRITEGHLADVFGIVKMDEGDRVKVLIHILGGEHVVGMSKQMVRAA